MKIVQTEIFEKIKFLSDNEKIALVDAILTELEKTKSEIIRLLRVQDIPV